MAINNLIPYLLKSVSNANANVHETLNRFIDIFENDLKEGSPVDKGDYKDSWERSEIRVSGDSLSSTISNKMSYGPAIEFGSMPGSSPWPNPGPKTVFMNGGIFSSQAPNGTINNVIGEKSISLLTISLANAVIKGFKNGL